MPTFPEPPSIERLSRIGVNPHIHVLPVGTELWRVYFRGIRHPTTWNTFRSYGPVPTARFDHHLPPPHEQERGMCYTASAGPICLAEVFQATRVIDRTDNAPWMVSFRLVADVHLLDLTGLWPTFAGGSQEINTGDRGRTQEWSRAIYTAFPDIDGLWYRSKMHGSMPAVALYERARRALPTAPTFHMALTAPGLFDLLNDVAAQLGYTLL